MKQQTETAFTKGDEGKSNDFFFKVRNWANYSIVQILRQLLEMELGSEF